MDDMWAAIFRSDKASAQRLLTKFYEVPIVDLQSLPTARKGELDGTDHR
jgi:hypothetical protein